MPFFVLKKRFLDFARKNFAFCAKSYIPDSEEVLKKMVQGVNRSTVAPEERLSDEVYKFDGRSIRLAGSGGLERDPDHMEPLTHRHSRSF